MQSFTYNEALLEVKTKGTEYVLDMCHTMHLRLNITSYSCFAVSRDDFTVVVSDMFHPTVLPILSD